MVEPFTKYGIDVVNQYVMEREAKLEKLTVLACYGYVSQTPDICEGQGQNVFYSDRFGCFYKRRRIDTLSQFLRAVGLDGVNQHEVKKLLAGGLPRANVTVSYWDQTQRKKVKLTVKNCPPVFSSEDHNADTRLGKHINVLVWDPIMHNYYSSLKSSVGQALQHYTARELDLGLRLINYYRENAKRRRGRVLVRNVSRDNVDKLLNLEKGTSAVVEPGKRDAVRDRALQKSKDIGLLRGYKFFPESKLYLPPGSDVQVASVENLNGITAAELKRVLEMQRPDMVTLVYNTDNFLSRVKPNKNIKNPKKNINRLT